jgi:uncharacterized membrane protein YgdD (TMEM256/DUF423 family)
MRWKLLLIVPLAATLLGAGLAFGLVRQFNDHPGRFLQPTPFTWATVVWTLGVVAFAGVFVYRHTSRRRRLQAALTAGASAVLCLALMLYVSR